MQQIRMNSSRLPNCYRAFGWKCYRTSAELLQIRANLEELRWLATYVALSRPPSLAQLISVGLPDELRNIIEGGPPEGILSKFNDMFKEKEEATHLKAAEVMRELGWDATD